MRYLIEPIGAEFSTKAIGDLSQKFTDRGNEGYRLHSVFQVTQPGCLGLTASTSTYLAVYIMED